MAKEKLTFEQALEKLEDIVSRIEEGKVSLEDSIERYAEGVKLVEQCRGILDRAERKIQLLSDGKDGPLKPAGGLDEDDE